MLIMLWHPDTKEIIWKLKKTSPFNLPTPEGSQKLRLELRTETFYCKLERNNCEYYPQFPPMPKGHNP